VDEFRSAAHTKRVARLVDRIVVLRLEHAAIRKRDAARDVADPLGDHDLGERDGDGRGRAVHVHLAVGAEVQAGIDASRASSVEIAAGDHC
jgi:hypothetical protein